MDKLEQYLKVTTAERGIWMGDGSIAYTCDESGTQQIWKLFPGGEPVQLTHFTSSARPCYSPEGTGDLYFMMDTNGDEHAQIYFLKAGETEPQNLTNNPKARHEFGGILPDGRTLVYSSNARAHRSFDICAMDIKTGAKRILVQNPDNLNVPSGLSPDGRWLLYLKSSHIDNKQLWVTDTSSGEARRILPVEMPEYGNSGNFGSPVWKKDSSGFYVLCDIGSNFVYAASYDLASGAMTPVYQPDWDVTHLALSQDNETLALTVREDGVSRLVLLNINDYSRVNTITPPEGIITLRDHAWRDGRLLFSLTTPTRPLAMWMLDVKNDTLVRLTHSRLNGLYSGDFCECIRRRFRSFDGLSVPYYVFQPKGVSTPFREAIIYCHGGPEGEYCPKFNGLHQYYMSQGIALIAPNVRGSIGYGKEYEHLDDVEKRLDSVKDVEALVEHLVAEGILQRGHIAVMGGSYGGYMTLACIAEFPDLFSAAVDSVGISNLETFLENTSDYRRAHREAEYGSLERDREVLRAVSPIHKVDRIKTPLYVIAGVTDPRVPISESDQMVEALRAKGNIVEYGRYEDEGHGLVKLKNKLDCYPRVAAFLKEHM